MLYEQLLDELIDSNENRFQNAAQPLVTAGLMLPHVEEGYEDTPVLYEKPVYEWMKLEPEYFPPSGYWEDEDNLKLLCGMFRTLFNNYNYDVAMPWHIPLTMEYDLWLKLLQTSTVCFLTVGEGDQVEVIPVCEENPATCPFGAHCLKNEDGQCNENRTGENWDRYYL